MLLPGITVLIRLVAPVREAAAERMQGQAVATAAGGRSGPAPPNATCPLTVAPHAVTSATCH